MNIFPLLLQTCLGLVGGNIAGASSAKFDIGVLGNSLVGLLGGGVGGQFYQYISDTGASSSDISLFMTNAAGGSIGGAVAVAVIGCARNFLRSSRVPSAVAKAKLADAKTTNRNFKTKP